MSTMQHLEQECMEELLTREELMRREEARELEAARRRVDRRSIRVSLRQSAARTRRTTTGTAQQLLSSSPDGLSSPREASRSMSPTRGDTAGPESFAGFSRAEQRAVSVLEETED